MVTAEGNDLRDVQRQVYQNERRAMIEVDADHGGRDFAGDEPPRFWRIRFAYGDETGSKSGLTLDQLNAEIKRILGKHVKWLAAGDAAKAKRDAITKSAELRAARQQLKTAKAAIKKLERR